MAYSDLNYASPKVIKKVFGLTDAKFTMLAVEGKFRFKRKYKNPLVYMESIASMYEDRDNLVVKRWGYDYQDPKEEYLKMKKIYSGFPRVFFRAPEGAMDGYYRVFYKGEAMRVLLYVFDGFVKVVSFSRDFEDELDVLYEQFENGKVDWEG